MVEGSEGGGPGPGPTAGFVSNPASSVESAGGRTRFTVELRPGETTIVSWKKLLREANSSMPNRPGPSISGPEAQRQPVSQPPPPSLPPASPEPFEEKEQNDSQVQAGSNRLSNVIERIERMYAGNGSSDEDNVMLDNVPDDDEYDTDDSFIDDAELNDYFQVDNSRTKHHGFFVNRGKLDRVEPTIPTSQQPKKRKRKDLTNNDDGHNPNRIVKTGIKGRKASSLIQKNPTSQSHKVATPNIHGEDMQFQAVPANAAEVPMKKKTADPHTDGVIRKDKDIDGPTPEILSSKNHSSSKGKESGPQDTSTHRSNGKSSHASKSHSGKQLNDADNLEKGGLAASFDLNLPTPKVAFMPRKEGSSSRPKSTTLEKAIRELEQTVAESRPPSTEVQDPDNASQAVKRRLPPEIKQKLAKVARLAQGSYGRIPMDLINHLMNIVGHLMQVRTLKRNLRDMANMGLSAKKEKDDRIEKIKQEVADMVKQRIPYMKSKAEQQAANSDDFQEAGPEEKEASKCKHSMDDALGNKICDLYDLYVELVVLWPSGFMDTDGIKRAIYRAKDKRGLFSSRKDREKIKKKNAVPPKIEDVINVTKALHIHEKPPCSDPPSTLARKPVVPSGATGRNPVADFAKNSPKADKPKQEKAKTSPNGDNPIDAMPSNLLPRKKIKKKPNPEALDGQLRLEKTDQRPKLHKHVAQSN
ncbi:hypothetical protein PHJA_000574100 [Phtheirospermum japonicum]|uniref:Hpc2-related domain-containing protein n=1 Tax=Phtheirospermum japonicum TaxID=374723 RepID=A0A830BHS3_9LAMI|nr:hypothetical protein PHJA_000574100 [Phtheirospermum japonicum]